MPISRNVSIKAVFAKNANTTIPLTPTSGTSYRDESVTQTDVENGWPFKTIVDSSKFNEIIYQISSICKMLEEFGMLPWSGQTDYVAGSFCLGSDGKLYQAIQASGPSTTVKEPTSNVGTYWNLYGSDYVTLGTTQDITGNKTFSGSVGLGSSATATTPASATDDSNKVATTKWVKNHLNNSTVSEKLNGYTMPDYSSSVSVSSGWTATANGVLICEVDFTESASGSVSVGGVVVFGVSTSFAHDMGNHKVKGTVFIAKGKKVTFSHATVKFCPCFGG